MESNKSLEIEYENLVKKVMNNRAFEKAVKGQISYFKDEGYATVQSPLSENGTVAVVVVKARNNFGVGMDKQPDIQNDMDEISKLYDKIILTGAIKKRKKRSKSKASKKSKPSKKSKSSKGSKKRRTNKSRRKTRRR